MSLAIDTIKRLINATVESTPLGLPSYAEVGINVRLTALKDAEQAVMMAEAKALEHPRPSYLEIQAINQRAVENNARHDHMCCEHSGVTNGTTYLTYERCGDVR